MSENSPRWPGANGSPGLDFSPWRKPADGGLYRAARGRRALHPEVVGSLREVLAATEERRARLLLLGLRRRDTPTHSVSLRFLKFVSIISTTIVK